MLLQPNFSNSDNWQLLGQLTGNAQLVNVNGVDRVSVPIGVLTFPLIVDNFTLAIATDLNYVGSSRWKWGGLAQYIINTGITVGGNPDSIVAQKPLFIDQITIIRFPKLSNSYVLKIRVPDWFHDVTYNIYGYSGDGNPDLESKLDTIHTEVTT